MQSGLGQSGVGVDSVVGLGVVFGERVGRATTGLGLASGVGVDPQADRVQIVNNKRAVILDFINVLSPNYGEGGV